MTPYASGPLWHVETLFTLLQVGSTRRKRAVSGNRIDNEARANEREDAQLPKRGSWGNADNASAPSCEAPAKVFMRQCSLSADMGVFHSRAQGLQGLIVICSPPRTVNILYVPGKFVPMQQRFLP